VWNRELHRRLLRHSRIGDRVASIDGSVLWPVSFMAALCGTPARSRFRTAVRRKSWTSRPGTPASLPAFAPITPHGTSYKGTALTLSQLGIAQLLRTEEWRIGRCGWCEEPFLKKTPDTIAA